MACAKKRLQVRGALFKDLTGKSPFCLRTAEHEKMTIDSSSSCDRLISCNQEGYDGSSTQGVKAVPVQICSLSRSSFPTVRDLMSALIFRAFLCAARDHREVLLRKYPPKALPSVAPDRLKAPINHAS